jgi:biopolymer transport protein ExbB
MSRRKRKGVSIVVFGTCVVFGSILAGAVGFAGDPGPIDRLGSRRQGDAVDLAERRGTHDDSGLIEFASVGLGRLRGRLIAWYGRTPPSERVTWGGLAACAGLGLVVLVERTIRLRRRRIVPADFTARFVDRLHAGKLDCGEALDHCERNPSPAARVALAAVRRWGRPAADLERAVTMAHRVETERLRRNVGTLRRVAALAALLGVLGTLFALGRALESIPPGGAPTAAGLSPAPAQPDPTSGGVAWGPMLAAAITPLSTGIIIATLALVAYDGVLTRVEKLAGALDRLGAETIEAVALSTPPAPTPIAMSRTPHQAGH